MRDRKIVEVKAALEAGGLSDEEAEVVASELESNLVAFDGLVYVLLNGTPEQKLDIIEKVIKSDNAPALSGLVLAGAARYCELVVATKVAAEKPARTTPDEQALFT